MRQTTPDRSASRRGEGRSGDADALPEPIRALLGDLSLDDALGRAVHAQIARALEAAVRTTKRKSSALGKAAALSKHPPASGLGPERLIPLILGVRDVLKTVVPSGRASRGRADRLDRAADAALRGLAARGGARTRADARGAKPGDGAGRDSEPDPAREVLQRLVALTPDAVLTVHASGRLGLWSVAASRMTGRRRWEIQRRGLGALFREKGAFDALIADLEEGGRVTNREIALVNAAGDDVPVRLYGAKLKAPRAPAGREQGARRGRKRRDDDPDRYVLLFHDLTEVHHIRRRLIETEKLSAMAKIAGSVAHEFRNPLNSLFLSADLLEDELEGREAVRESIAPTLAAIREEIERLNQIITHYLALSKISSASPEVMDLGEAVRQFAEESRPHWQSDEADLRVRTDEGDLRITADPNQVRRILVNLVENAVDAVRDGEEAEERRARRGLVTLQVRRMRRSVKLTVKDNGSGIPEDIREKVFEPFFTSKVGGSGLGLYLVREIALASGGAMTLSSTVGRGTSVSIRWPFAESVERKD
jgi:signal transduction histidine kinase